MKEEKLRDFVDTVDFHLWDEKEKRPVLPKKVFTWFVKEMQASNMISGDVNA